MSVGQGGQDRAAGKRTPYANRDLSELKGGQCGRSWHGPAARDVIFDNRRASHREVAHVNATDTPAAVGGGRGRQPGRV